MSKTIAGNRWYGTLVSEAFGKYRGCYRLPNGKFAAKMFEAKNSRDAIAAWDEWRQRQAAKYHKDERIAAHVPITATTTIDQDPEEDLMAQPTKAVASKAPGTYFVLQVVGGPALYVFTDFDTATNVCGALEAAAKASGFSAKYDVTEVKLWEA